MFSLIISIIAIALVAALAAASVYYGGSAFSKGTAGADASTFINNGQQVNGAFTLASTEGSTAASLADLVSEEYLSQIPSYKGTALTLDGDDPTYVSITVSSQVCGEIIKRGGQDAGFGLGAVEAPSELYACNVSGSSYTAYYKVK